MLEGTRVVELGMWVAGPGAGALMADWGAEVVKVESPEGDPMRRLFALMAGHGQPQSPPFDHDNRGKHSVVADVAEPEGRQVVEDLLAEADVLLTNLRPAALARAGLSPGEVLGRHPGLVYASVTGYGLEGPDADRAGYDVGAFWARSGAAMAFAPEGRNPFPLRGGFGDHITSLAAVAGVLAALLARERTGRGNVVDASLLRVATWCLGWDVAVQERFGKVAPTLDRAKQMNPLVNCYCAADGKWFWLLGVEADRLWPKLCSALEREDLVGDERFSGARARRKNVGELVPLLDGLFATADRDAWAARFDEHDVWWAPVNTLADLADDPQVQAVGALVDVPGGQWVGPHRAAASPISFRDPDMSRLDRIPGPPPALDEHPEDLWRS